MNRNGRRIPILELPTLVMLGECCEAAEYPET